MVQDHSDRESGNLMQPLHGLLFLISSNDYFICTIPDTVAHTTAFDTPVMEHWLEREIAQWVPYELSIPSHHEWTLYHRVTSRFQKKEKQIDSK